MVSEKRESESEIQNEGQDPGDETNDHGDHEDDDDPVVVPGWQ